jgi:DNA-binding IscR family transcriptional regulator
MTACVSEARHDCALDHRCAVKPHWGAVNGAVRDALAGITLATLTRVPAADAQPMPAEA